MLGEYKVGRCTRQCHALQRPLRSGEWYYSVVVEDGEDFKRREYSAEGWTEPPENAVGWWKSRMPVSDEKKMVLAPPEVLVDLLRQMDEVPGREKSRYLLALMLLRRRVLKAAQGVQDQTNQGVESLRVEVATTAEVIEIPVPSITRGEAESLKDELNELLYCEAEEETFEGDEEDAPSEQSMDVKGEAQ